MYKIVLDSWGSTSKEFMSELTLNEAVEICESYNWVINFDGAGYYGYEWDMRIEEYEGDC